MDIRVSVVLGCGVFGFIRVIKVIRFIRGLWVY
jgi:hypothetical protein